MLDIAHQEMAQDAENYCQEMVQVVTVLLRSQVLQR